MPSLFRFLTILAVFASLIAGSLYIFAVYFEPVPREVSKPVSNVKIRKAPEPEAQPQTAAQPAPPAPSN